MTNALGLKEGDEIDFLKSGDRQFILAKKSDLVALLTGQPQKAQAAASAPPQRPAPPITQEELAVLRKLDTIRYGERTKTKLKSAFNAGERKVIVELIKKKYVEPFKKAGETEFKYGISKRIYNAYLFGKREGAKPAAQAPAPAAPPPQQPQQPKRWERQITQGPGGYLNALEANGFLVVENQAEASTISAELEESIRRGLVIGTRAFNKKYYITLKSFVNKNAMKIVDALGSKATKVSDVSKATGIDEEGIRAILYMMAEQGEVTETRKDIFKVV